MGFCKNKSGMRGYSSFYNGYGLDGKCVTIIVLSVIIVGSFVGLLVFC